MSESRLDKMFIAMEDMQTKQTALTLKQESNAEEKRKLQEELSSMKKSYLEAVMVRWNCEWNP